MSGKIICGDCVEVMRSFDDCCIDLTVTSPPYDNLRKYNGFTWDFESTVKELYRVTKDGGVVVWIVGDGTHNGSETLTSFKQALFFKECGFRVHDTMVWKKTNPMPKIKTTRYFDVFEYMFVFSKGKPKTFNPIMVDCKTAGQKYNSTCKNMGGENGRTHKSFLINKQRYKDNIWEIAVAQNKTSHPAVFPEKLAHDHIISWSNKGDTVLDPMCGSGTTLKMAKLLGRDYIGIDCCESYCDISMERVYSVAYSSAKVVSE